MQCLFVLLVLHRHLPGMWVWCVDHTAPRNYSRSAPHSLQPQSGQSRHSVQELPQCCSHPHSSQMYLIRLSICLEPLQTFCTVTHFTFFTVVAFCFTMRCTGTSMTFFFWHYNSLNFLCMSVLGSLLCSICFNLARVCALLLASNLL